MSVGDRWWDQTPAPAADTGSADTGATAPSKPTVQDLGNGYSLVTYTDDLGMPKSQIVPNKDAASVAAVEAAKIAAGGVGVSASISANAANQRAAIQAEIDRARLAADEAHNRALEALAQGNAAEARRQFDISSQETQRYHSADISLRQQDQDLAKAKFGQDVYDKLANLASNPRNYMEQFFRLRGQQGPADVAKYGNTSVTGPGLMTFDQFLPNFLKSTGLSQGATAPTSPSSAAAPTSPVSPTQTSAGGLAGSPGMQQDLIRAALAGAHASPQSYASNNMTIPGTGPVIGGAAGANDTATVNGSRITGPGAGALAAGGWTPQPNLPENTQLSVDAREDRNLRQFAGGGTLRMTAPHAIVNLLSGKVAAIAGEQPGRGPQGFVPESAKFSGQAIIDPYKDPSSGLPPPEPPPDPFTPIPVAGQTNVFAGAVAPPDTGVPATLGPDTSLRTSSPTFTASPVSSSPVPSPGVSAPSISFADQQKLIDQTGAGVHPATTTVNSPMPQPGMGGGTPTTGTLDPAGTMTGPAPTTGTGTVGTSTGPAPTPGVTVMPPLPQPGADTGTPGPGITDTAGTNAWGGPLSQTPSGFGKNPSFLPENLASQDPIIDAMLKSGAFPPFLQRVFAQQMGLAGLGTNVPQQTNLPVGVPLISQLALNQMSPSEFSAFQSYLSAHGVDWNDYIAMVREASPQGNTGGANPNMIFNPQFPR